MTGDPLLRVSDLIVSFRSAEGEIPAVTSFSGELLPGEVVAIVGESGCGKSVTAHAIIQILPPSAVISGEVYLSGKAIHSLPETILEEIRGREIVILFQNPDRALNPLYRIGRQVLEPVRAHRGKWDKIDRNHALSCLRESGCDDPRDIFRKYPCQCSGGMNQRALLAVTTALSPRVFIADEPTKGLDKDKVAGVAAFLLSLRSQDRGILLITHDLMLAEAVSDRIFVMYAGEVVESGATGEVIASPCHPYTRGLLKSLPESGFVPIPGMSPAFSNLPPGCRFAPRCPDAGEECHRDHPSLIRCNGREVRCLRP